MLHSKNAVRLLSWCLLGVAVLGVVALSPRRAMAEETPRLIYSMQGKHVEDALDALNLPSKEVRAGLYSFEHKGLKVGLLYTDRTLMLQARFIDTSVTMAQMNGWNKKERFTRAYLDGKTAILEADHEVTGGVTPTNVKEWVKTYLDRLHAFKKFLDGAGTPPPVGAPAPSRVPTRPVLPATWTRAA